VGEIDEEGAMLNRLFGDLRVLGSLAVAYWPWALAGLFVLAGLCYACLWLWCEAMYQIAVRQRKLDLTRRRHELEALVERKPPLRAPGPRSVRRRVS